MVHTQCVAFVNNIGISSHTRIVLQYTSLSNSLSSNLLRITVTTTFNFPAEEQNVCIRKNI